MFCLLTYERVYASPVRLFYYLNIVHLIWIKTPGLRGHREPTTRINAQSATARTDVLYINLHNTRVNKCSCYHNTDNFNLSSTKFRS